MSMSREEAHRCHVWQEMFANEFPSLRIFFWKLPSGEYEVQVRRCNAYTHRAEELLMTDKVPTLFFGQFPSPEFITKCAIVA